MTETANYKLKKPGAEELVDIEVLNENMDIIDEQLGKASYYELDLREVTDFDFVSGEKSQSIIITEYVNADELFAAAADGKVIRLLTKDSVNGLEIRALLTDYLNYTDDDTIFRAVQGSFWANTGVNTHSHFSILQWGENAVRLRWSDNAVPTNVLKSTGWDPNKYLGTDADGNVVAVEAPEGGGTVKTVNGVAPDENGNVEITAEVLKAVSMDLSNWDSGSFSVTYADGAVSEFGVTFDESGRPATISDGTTDFAITWPAEEESA